MSIKFEIKPFAALSAVEVYEVLRLRSEVFVVEQNCVYQDIDGKDLKALHVIGTFNSEIVAYTRLFSPGYYFDNASIGRVVVSPKYRAHKFGHSLIKTSIDAIFENFGTGIITISAQEYLKKFYETHGFLQEGEGYLEDDIPHIKMNRGIIL